MQLQKTLMMMIWTSTGVEKVTETNMKTSAMEHIGCHELKQHKP